MTYQILYFSPRGYVEKVARALWTLLPEGTACEPLVQQTPEAEVQLIGFEYQLGNGKRLPEPVEAYLKKQTGKTVFLFSTVSFQPGSSHSGVLHRLAEEALPRTCDYRGMYLCRMEPCESTLEAMRDHSEQNPDNQRAKYWLDRHEKAQGHPDEKDLEEARIFAAHVLNLKK